MTAKQYIAALKKLGLTHASQETARLLGISVRRSQRIAGDEAAVPEPVALLLAMYLKHGLPTE